MRSSFKNELVSKSLPSPLELHPAAIIFDMDGVLIDSEPLHEEAFYETFRELGIDRPLINFRDFLGQTDIAVWKAFIKHHPIGIPIEQLVQFKRERVIRLICQKRPLASWADFLLNSLKLRGYSLALASGSAPEVIKTVLKIGGWDKIFDAVVSSEEVGRPKPAPDTYLAAAKVLQVEPDRCIAIEDSPAGIRAAKTAGMWVIGVSWTVGASGISEADWQVDLPSQLCKLLGYDWQGENLGYDESNS